MAPMETCSALTKLGKICRRRVVPGTDYCFDPTHINSTTTIPKRWEAPFLEAFADLGVVSYAAHKVRKDPSTIYRRRKESTGFDAAFLEAEERALGSLEHELVRRGRDGTLKPIFQGKELVGHTREYSDACLIFALKARAPHKYRERVDVSGNIHHTMRSELDERIDGLLGQFDGSGGAAFGQGAGGAGDAGRPGSLDS